MTDIVERLKDGAAINREIATVWAGEKRDHHILRAELAEDAATEIERLRSALAPSASATELAKKIIPSASSEWPLDAHGHAIVVGHASNLIQAALVGEREACAKVAESEGQFRGDGDGEIWIANRIAAAIRSRT